jgi:DNA mismatch repair protein MutS2
MISSSEAPAITPDVEVAMWRAAAGKLEFERVLGRVVRHAQSEAGAAVLSSAGFSSDLSNVVHELTVVSEMKRLIEEEEEMPLSGIHSIAPALQKSGIEGALLQPKELLHIVLTARASRLARMFLARHREKAPLLWDVAEPLLSDKVLEFNIDRAIDETGAVRTAASKELESVRRAIAEKSDQLRKRLEGILRTAADLGFNQDDLITTREGRMVIPVKTEHKNRVPGFIHSASSSGATVFIEPTETLELNNDLRSLQFQEQREIDRILRSLTSQVGERRGALRDSLERLATIDAYNARARYSIESLGVQPEMTADGPIRLVRARHPVLLINHGVQGTVPLDLELGDRYTTLVISGPNAGGKSVAMKCTGLICLMAQAGLHIPAADGTRLRILRSMFVDIGDDQSIENDLSTFSSHLRQLKDILDGADDGSLVLIDEIGSGTDPAEGGAIAAAVLEGLTASGALTIATTHHSALKVFAHDTDGVENGAMEFDQDSLTPTYRFRAGVPGSSYALEMAERLGIRHDHLSRAREFLGSQQVRLDALITDLESSLQKTRRRLDEAESERSRLDALRISYEAQLASLQASVKETKRKAAEEAASLIARANATIEQSVKAIRESRADQQVVKSTRKEIDQVRKEIDSERKSVEPEEEPAPPSGAIANGSLVTIKGSSDTGEVASISADGKTATVVFGAVRMKVRMSDLVLTTKKRKYRDEAPATSEKPDAVQTELDIRGLTGEEALPMVDKLLDEAMLSGLRRVDIIHGKGTGALRKRVIDFLSTHASVKSFRPGEWNEGGMGVTVVELG